MGFESVARAEQPCRQQELSAKRSMAMIPESGRVCLNSMMVSMPSRSGITRSVIIGSTSSDCRFAIASFAVAGLHNAVACIVQQVAQQTAHAFFVIHHQNPRRHLRRSESFAYLRRQRIGIERLLQNAWPASTSERYAATSSVYPDMKGTLGKGRVWRSRSASCRRGHSGHHGAVIKADGTGYLPKTEGEQIICFGSFRRGALRKWGARVTGRAWRGQRRSNSCHSSRRD
jgi:hypothetical protein